MNRELWLLAALGLGFTGGAEAEVYRCEKDGKLQYSDRACVKGDAPVALPPLSTVHREASERALAKQYDHEASAQRRAKASADAEWKKSYSSRKKNEARVQEGRIKGEVVVGMSEQEVHALLGEPDSQRGNRPPRAVRKVGPTAPAARRRLFSSRTAR